MQDNSWEWTTEATAIKSTRIAFPEYGVFRQLENDDDLSANLAGNKCSDTLVIHFLTHRLMHPLMHH